MNALTDKALGIALDAHSGAVDRYGNPYILHVIRVGMAGKSPEEIITGFLHDVVEDSEWTITQLSALGFPDDILTAVECLTKREGEEYSDFVSRSATHPLARSVKMNDLKDNLNLLRVKGDLSENDLQRLNKYLRAIEFLEKRA